MLTATNGPAPALAVVVQRARDQLLAGARLSPVIITVRSVVISRAMSAVDLLHRRRRGRSAAGARSPIRRRRGAAACSARAPPARARPPSISSCRSNGFGRYSKAPRSVAFTAVSSVFCALMTMTRRSGRSLRMRGMRSSPFSSGITHVGDDEIALAVLDPAPERRRVAGAAHLVAERGPAPGSARCGSSGRRRRPGWSSPCSWFVLLARRHRQHARGIWCGRGSLSTSIEPAVIADDLGHQRQAEAAAGRAWRSRTDRTDAAQCHRGMPGPLSCTRHHQRQMPLGRQPGTASACRAGSGC